MRASVTEAHATVSVYVYMPKGCAFERKYVHAYMHAAEDAGSSAKKKRKEKKTPWLNHDGGGGGGIQSGESEVNGKAKVQLHLRYGEPKASSLFHRGNGWSLVRSTTCCAFLKSSSSSFMSGPTFQQGALPSASRSALLRVGYLRG